MLGAVIIQERSRVEDTLAKVALRTRSTVRKEIRAERQKAKAQEIARNLFSRGNQETQTEGKRKTAKIVTPEPSHLQKSTEASSNSRFKESEAGPSRTGTGEADGHPKCKSLWWFAVDEASGDAVLDALLLLSFLLAG